MFSKSIEIPDSLTNFSKGNSKIKLIISSKWSADFHSMVQCRRALFRFFKIFTILRIQELLLNLIYSSKFLLFKRCQLQSFWPIIRKEKQNKLKLWHSRSMSTEISSLKLHLIITPGPCLCRLYWCGYHLSMHILRDNP